MPSNAARDAVIVFRRYRIKFMVVASRRSNRQPQKGTGRCGNDLVERRGSNVGLSNWILIPYIIIGP